MEDDTNLTYFFLKGIHIHRVEDIHIQLYLVKYIIGMGH